MQSVAGAWLMTTLTSSALLVALMQTAISLPMFLLSLPAGVLGDLLDRRRLILSTQALMLLASCLLAVLTWFGAIESWSLLALTFVLGTGMALNGPAWQSSMCEAIDRAELAQALTLIGIAYNIARAVGPAVAGGIQTVAGPWLVFLVNATAAAGFGFLSGGLGVGALLGGLALHWLRERVVLETQIRAASVGYALTLALAAVLSDVRSLCPALVLGGAAWSIALTSLGSALLTSVPMWVRSRTIALSMLASQGFMAGGAALWGVVATHGGTDLALALASGLMVILMIWVRR